MEIFVYRAVRYRKVLDFQYDFCKVEKCLKEKFEDKAASLEDILETALSLGQFDNPAHKKSYEKMLQDGYVRFDIGKGHGVLFFFERPPASEDISVHVKCVIAS